MPISPACSTWARRPAYAEVVRAGIKWWGMDANWWVVVDPGTSKRRIVPVHHRLVVGRECVGVAPDLRLILDEPSVSRNHLEIRIAPDGGATLIDASTNGTRVNGSTVQRGAKVPLRRRQCDRAGQSNARRALLARRRGG